MKNNVTVLAGLLLSWLPGLLVAGTDDEYTDTFPIADCNFSTVGGNSYFILKPGRVSYYDNSACVEEGDCDELESLVITVLPETKTISLVIDGQERKIKTRVVQEYETVGPELEFAERSLNYFAVCQESGDVYYFGEKVFVPEGGQPGAWEAGVDGAMPGIIMPGGAFLLGARYYQEVAPEVALDRAEHTAMGLEAGDYTDCVEVTETTQLEKKAESIKVYCPGVGLTVDDDLELYDVKE